MRIGITGGTGNISLYITRRLIRAGHDVVVFNRSGTTVEGADTVQVDRHDTGAFIEAVRSANLDVGIDMIVFTAADARVSLKAFADVTQLIHCSTGATYGFPLPIPVTEETPLRAEQPYGSNKNEADRIFLSAHFADGFPVTIIKPNITYGHKWTHRLPGQLPGNWLRRVVDGKPIVVVGDGNQLHHFHHADDSARGFVGCVGNERTIGHVFNNTATQAYTWRELHETAMRIVGKRVPIVGVPRQDLLALRAQHPDLEERNFWHHMDVSNAKLRRVVPDYHQAHTLEDGLSDILAGFDPGKVATNGEEIDTMLDDLAARQGRVAE